MTDKQVGTIIKTMYIVASVLVLVGATFRLQHYSHGFLILLSGFVLGGITSSVDTYRLKQKIKRLEKKIKPKG